MAQCHVAGVTISGSARHVCDMGSETAPVKRNTRLRGEPGVLINYSSGERLRSLFRRNDTDMPGPGCFNHELEHARACERQLPRHRSLIVFAALGRAGNQFDVVLVDNLHKEFSACRAPANFERPFRLELCAGLDVGRAILKQQRCLRKYRCRRNLDQGNGQGSSQYKCVKFTVKKAHDHSRLFVGLSVLEPKRCVVSQQHPPKMHIILPKAVLLSLLSAI